jgi:homogentisate 1,2-dioxygenase
MLPDSGGNRNESHHGPHGPQPGAVENSIGKEDTDEVAIMVETYEPLKMTKGALKVEDQSYMYSWYR